MRSWNCPGPYKETIKELEKQEGKTFKEILYELFWEQGLSMRDIAFYLNEQSTNYSTKSFNVRKNYVRRRMIMYGIPVRVYIQHPNASKSDS